MATAVGGVPYVVRNGIDGFLIPPNDPAALSQKMVDLIINERKRLNLAEQGFERAKKEFDLNNNIEFLIKRYQDILET
jgi:glycosyltransferase involved in cell wall biosynthesis